MMRFSMQSSALAFSLAGALAVSTATPSFSTPALSNVAALKAAAPNDTSEVRWRRGWGGGAIVGGLALGLIGSAVANSYYYSQPYGYSGYYPSYGYGEPSYGYGEPSYGYYAPRRYYRPYPYSYAAYPYGWRQRYWNGW